MLYLEEYEVKGDEMACQREWENICSESFNLFITVSHDTTTVHEDSQISIDMAVNLWGSNVARKRGKILKGVEIVFVLHLSTFT